MHWNSVERKGASEEKEASEPRSLLPLEEAKLSCTGQRLRNLLTTVYRTCTDK